MKTISLIMKYKPICILAVLLLIGCSPRMLVEYEDQSVNSAFDLHAVSIVTGRDKYNIASYSHIGRDAKQSLEPNKIGWITVEQNQYKDWKWKFVAMPSVASNVAIFSKPLVLKEHHIDGEPVILPSFAQLMRKFRLAAGALAEQNLPSFEYRLAFIPSGINAKRFVEHHSNDTIILDYILPAPEMSHNLPINSIDWASSVLDLQAHEFLHAYVETSPYRRLPNAFTEEVTAYTFQYCIQLYAFGKSGGLRIFDDSGKIETPESALKENLRQGFLSTTTSVNARAFALYEIVYILGKGTIHPTDIKAKNMLYGLCRAMIHNPLDLTKTGFYPRNLVRPFSLPE